MKKREPNHRLHRSSSLAASSQGPDGAESTRSPPCCCLYLAWLTCGQAVGFQRCSPCLFRDLPCRSPGPRKPGSSWRGHLPKAGSRARSKLPLGAQAPPEALGPPGLRLSAVGRREAAGKEGCLSQPSAAAHCQVTRTPLISLDPSTDYSHENRIERPGAAGVSSAEAEGERHARPLCGVLGAAAVSLILSGR